MDVRGQRRRSRQSMIILTVQRPCLPQALARALAIVARA